MVLDSQRWKCVESIPPLLFSIEGLSAVRGRGGRTGWLTLAEGVVETVRPRHLVLEDDVTLGYVLPPRVDLRPLVASRVKLTLADEPVVVGPRAQTLTVADATGRTLLLARFGKAGQAHVLGKSRVRTALSQRPDGPIAFGTDRLQYVVQVGEYVRVQEPGGEFVVCFLARTAYDYVAYLIVDRTLWINGRR
jgi:hypothetical protein